MTPVARGLARNPAAPADLLLRLLDDHPDIMREVLRSRADLPGVVVEAAARHADDEVRAAVACNSHVDPGVRLALLDDPSFRVAQPVTLDRGLPLPARAFTLQIDRMLKIYRRDLMTALELTSEIQEIASFDPRAIDAIAAHPEPLVRAAAAGYVQPGTPLWARLAEDEAPEVREAALRRAVSHARLYDVADLPRHGYGVRGVVAGRQLTHALIAHVLADEQYVPAMAGNPHLPAEVLETLLAHRSAEVRAAVAKRPDLTRPQLDRLITDPDVTVRAAVSVHPALGEADLATIDLSTMETDDFAAVTCFHRRRHPAVPDQVAESVRLAASVNPLLRRRAAADPRLPSETVATLARDPDPQVRALLAHHNPAAPPELLLRVFLELPGCDRKHLPTFPADGLARFSGDPDPAVRALATRDPRATPDLLESLLTDPEPSVRHAAAAAPALPAARIAALLTDPDPEIVAAAASNAALPVPLMWSALQRS